jgi:hypothetical protein
MTRIKIVVVLGLMLLYFTPGEWLVQVGLRKIAFEQGIAAAGKHYDFMATAEAEPNPETDTPTSARKKAKSGTRAR